MPVETYGPFCAELNTCAPDCCDLDDNCNPDSSGSSSSSSGSSSSSSSSSSGGGVQTECCGTPIPTTLTLTLSDSSFCECADGLSFSLVYQTIEGVDAWYVTDNAPCPNDTDIPTTDAWSFKLICNESGGWELTVKCAGVTDTQTSFTCDPLDVLFTDLGLPSGCCNGAVPGSLTAAVTE